MTPKQEALWRDLERKILQGLSMEWEHAASMLPSDMRQRLPKPLFRIREMKSRWGYWDFNRREIVLSRNLVFRHAWDNIREVLHHETAHQLCDTVFGRDPRPHGKNFLRACRLLGANPKASGRFPALHDVVFQDRRKNPDRIMTRVQKLLALAESANPHEAEAAMAKAHRLIQKYNLDLVQSGPERNFHSIFLGKPALRHFRETYDVANLLQDFYYVQGIWVPSYVVEKERMGRVLEISGTASNLRIAAYVHDFIFRYINGQWKEYNRHGGLNRYRKTDFAVGILEGFRKKISIADDSRKRHDAAAFHSSELVRTDDPLLNQYMKAKYPHCRTIYRGGGSRQEDVFQDGIQAGKNMVISKGIEEKTSGAKRFLPGPGGK